jgi:hypothetical protein
MYPADPRDQIPIGTVARRWLTPRPCVEAAARDIHRPRHHLDREVGLVRGHEFEDLDDVASF